MMHLPPVLLMSVFGGLGVLVLAAGVPTGLEEYDLRVTTSLRAGAVGGEWSILGVSVEDKRSRILSTEALWHNGLMSLFGGEARVIQTTLEDSGGSVLQTQHEKTRESGFFAKDDSVVSVLRRVEPGTYVVRVRALDESGTAVSERTSTVQLLQRDAP